MQNADKEQLGDRLIEVRKASALTLALCFDEMLDKSDARRRFVCYLMQAYHYVSFACPLMERMLRKRDLLPVEMAEYLEQNLVEEAGHEQWLLEDLERLGLKRSVVQRSKPLRTTAALVGSQLYWLETAKPAVCFGYMFALERTAPTPERHRAGIDALSKRLGVEVEALSTFLRHGELDFAHQDEKVHLLNSVRLESDVAEGVLDNCRQTMLNLCDLFMEISGLPGQRLPQAS